jgi:hypothetical protein
VLSLKKMRKIFFILLGLTVLLTLLFHFHQGFRTLVSGVIFIILIIFSKPSPGGFLMSLSLILQVIQKLLRRFIERRVL